MDKTLIEKICSYFKTQPILKAWVFGSASRGEARPDSDIDIMVVFDPNAHVGLFKYSQIYTELKDLLGKEVDLVQDGALKPYAEATANLDRILIYERP